MTPSEDHILDSALFLSIHMECVHTAAYFWYLKRSFTRPVGSTYSFARFSAPQMPSAVRSSSNIKILMLCRKPFRENKEKEKEKKRKE